MIQVTQKEFREHLDNGCKALIYEALLGWIIKNTDIDGGTKTIITDTIERMNDLGSRWEDDNG